MITRRGDTVLHFIVRRRKSYFDKIQKLGGSSLDEFQKALLKFLMDDLDSLLLYINERDSDFVKSRLRNKYGWYAHVTFSGTDEVKECFEKKL